MMEFIFIGTNVAIEICLKKHKRTEKEDSRLTKQKSRPKTDALILRAEDKSYTELLKTVKQVGSQLHWKKTQQHTTKNRKLLLTVNSSKNRLDDLRTAITDKMKDVQAMTVRRVDIILYV